jgi:hypothetical protein
VDQIGDEGFVRDPFFLEGPEQHIESIGQAPDFILALEIERRARPLPRRAFEGLAAEELDGTDDPPSGEPSQENPEGERD